jgi:hypothetical protein
MNYLILKIVFFSYFFGSNFGSGFESGSKSGSETFISVPDQIRPKVLDPSGSGFATLIHPIWGPNEQAKIFLIFELGNGISLCI